MDVRSAKIIFEAEYGYAWHLNDDVLARLISDYARYDVKVLLAEMEREIARSYQGGA